MPGTNLLSYKSEGSILSIRSKGSILSIGSVGSIASIGSIGSFGSAFSTGSFLSAFSALSGLSAFSALSWRRRGGVLSAPGTCSCAAGTGGACACEKSEDLLPGRGDGRTLGPRRSP